MTAPKTALAAALLLLLALTVDAVLLSDWMSLESTGPYDYDSEAPAFGITCCGFRRMPCLCT
jgi:hypothetical protein